MAFDFASLEPHIHQILSAPGTDLSTISAKRVRRQLVELDLSLTAEFMRENRDDVDKVIASVFEKVSGDVGEDTPSDGVDSVAEEKEPEPQKRKQEDDDDDVVDDDGTEEKSPPVKKVKKASKNGRELSDAELARKLSSEINGRSTRTGAKGRGGATAGKRGSRAKKSAATVDSDDSDACTSKSTRRKQSSPAASTPRTGAKGGFSKEFALRHGFLLINLGFWMLISHLLYCSEPLAALLQVENLSRPQVVKQLWVYIKGNELQNPANKREILCDVKLRAVFGVDKIDMFKMNKVLGQ